MESNDTKDVQCSICLGLLINPVTTACGHSFCQHCLAEMTDFKANIGCPLCRKPIPSVARLSVNKELQAYIQRKHVGEYDRRSAEVASVLRAAAQMMRISVSYGNKFQKIEDQSRNTNEWCCFVKLDGIEGNESDYIERVEFLLHETFSIPLVKCSKPPYQVTRKGWGTFQIPIKIFWKSWLNIPKPTEVAWNLQFQRANLQDTFIVKVDRNTINQKNPLKPIA